MIDLFIILLMSNSSYFIFYSNMNVCFSRFLSVHNKHGDSLVFQEFLQDIYWNYFLLSNSIIIQWYTITYRMPGDADNSNERISLRPGSHARDGREIIVSDWLFLAISSIGRLVHKLWSTKILSADVYR